MKNEVQRERHSSPTHKQHHDTFCFLYDIRNCSSREGLCSGRSIKDCKRHMASTLLLDTGSLGSHERTSPPLFSPLRSSQQDLPKPPMLFSICCGGSEERKGRSFEVGEKEKKPYAHCCIRHGVCFTSRVSHFA